MKNNKIKCVCLSTTYFLLTFNISLTVGNYYEFKNINYRKGKIYVKNDKGIFQYYNLEWFDLNTQILRKIKLSNTSKKCKK